MSQINEAISTDMGQNNTLMLASLRGWQSRWHFAGARLISAVAIAAMLCIFLGVVDTKPTAAACNLNIPGGDVTALISAINCANGVASTDTINLASNSLYVLTATDNSSFGGNGLPVIANTGVAGTLVINGNGSTITRTSSDSFRILEVGSGGNLVSTTYAAKWQFHQQRWGHPQPQHTDYHEQHPLREFGGERRRNLPIDSAASRLTLTNTTISGNSASAGGGIYNSFGTVSLTDSTVSGNSAPSGGGIFNFSGTATLRSSTFASNTASNIGGGIYNYSSSTAFVINSTLSGNSAGSGGGGGIFSLGTATVTNSTFSGNSATSGAAGILSFGTLQLNNSIVAGSTGSSDCLGNVVMQYSLVQDGSCNIAQSASNLSGDPLLDPSGLANNGGATLTTALQAGSPAINTGSNALALDADGTTPLTYDQRGADFNRIIGIAVDMAHTRRSLVVPASLIRCLTAMWLT